MNATHKKGRQRTKELETRLFDEAESRLLCGDFPVEGLTLPIKRIHNLKEHLRDVDKFLEGHKHLTVTRYSNVRGDGVKEGRPCEVTITRHQLSAARPGIDLIAKVLDQARQRGKLYGLPIYGVIKSNLQLCKNKYAEMMDAVEIYHFITSNRSEIAGKYPRQLSHGLSTKLMGRSGVLLAIHKAATQSRPVTGEEALPTEETSTVKESPWDAFYSYFQIRQVETPFIFYHGGAAPDSQISAKLGLLSSTLVGSHDFSGAKGCLIVENKETFYALQETLPGDWIIIFGAGNGASAENLGTIAKRIPVPFYYWGDLDAAGLEIFSSVASMITGLIPLLMDRETIKTHGRIKQIITKCIKRPSLQALNNLGGLGELYVEVCELGIRIEQEQIPITSLMERLEALP